MIRIENLATYGWEAAIRGMRNPKNSWERSDSFYLSDEKIRGCILGENDLKLAKKLADGGPVHGKFLRMIGVSMDVTAPMYWWAEFDTYKVGTVRNSCSKMHKLLEKPFELDDFSFNRLPGYRKEAAQIRPSIDENTENWATLDANPAYEVSDCGRIRHGSRIIAGSLHQDGYIYVTISGRQIPVHRLVAQMFLSNPEQKPEINHKDGNKQNNQASNLEWMTSSENQKHAVEQGLQSRPTAVYKGKFSAETRETIKQRWASGETFRALAKDYGVSHTCIHDIVYDRYRYADKVNLFEDFARPLVDQLNELRDSYFQCEEEDGKKTIWYSILQILPESYNQRSTIMLNYAVLKNIYEYRRNHKLDEWHEFCRMIETLPYAQELIIGG